MVNIRADKNLDAVIQELNIKRKKDKAVVLFSGGQDSTTCLLYAIELHGADNIVAVSADYGQRHKIELVSARALADKLSIAQHRVIRMAEMSSELISNLTSSQGFLNAPHTQNTAVPASFVPARNALMLTMAHAVAAEIGASRVYAGMSQADYSGYPDCRESFIRTLESALNIGYSANISFITPLMWLSKGQTFALADHLQGLNLVLHETHTCYEGFRTPHIWGRGCARCPACILRRDGYTSFVHAYAGRYYPYADGAVI